MSDPQPTPIPAEYYAARRTDGGHLVVSADHPLSTDNTVGDRERSEHTGLVWLGHRDGMAEGRMPLLPEEAVALAHMLLAAAEVTTARLAKGAIARARLVDRGRGGD